MAVFWGLSRKQFRKDIFATGKDILERNASAAISVLDDIDLTTFFKNLWHFFVTASLSVVMYKYSTYVLICTYYARGPQAKKLKKGMKSNFFCIVALSKGF